MQTTFGAPAKAVAGLVADSFIHQYLSRAIATRQLVQLTFGTTNGTYTVSADGTQVATFTASSNTATQIRDDILADLAAAISAGAQFTAAALSTDSILIEQRDYDDAEIAFTISTVSGYSATKLVSQKQAVPFGLGVVRDDRAPASGLQARLPRLTTDISAGFLGILALDTAKEFNATGCKAGSMGRVLRIGHVYVVVEGAVAEQENLCCRFAAGAGGTQLGAFRSGTDSATALAVPGLKALEATTGAGIVLAEYIPNT